MDKTQKICMVLATRGVPMTRFELLEEVWKMDGRRIPFKRNSNNCYFVPSISSDPFMSSCEWKRSLLIKKLIKVVGKRGNARLFQLTPKGRRLAAGLVK